MAVTVSFGFVGISTTEASVMACMMAVKLVSAKIVSVNKLSGFLVELGKSDAERTWR